MRGSRMCLQTSKPWDTWMHLQTQTQKEQPKVWQVKTNTWRSKHYPTLIEQGTGGGKHWCQLSNWHKHMSERSKEILRNLHNAIQELQPTHDRRAPSLHTSCGVDLYFFMLIQSVNAGTNTPQNNSQVILTPVNIIGDQLETKKGESDHAPSHTHKPHPSTYKK